MNFPVEPPAEVLRDEPPRQFSLRGVMIGVTLLSVLIALLVALGTPPVVMGGVGVWVVVATGAQMAFGFNFRSWLVDVVAAAGCLLVVVIAVDALHREYDLAWDEYAQISPFVILVGVILGSKGWALVECASELIVWLDHILPGGRAGHRR